MSGFPGSDGASDRALDRALSRVLEPPAMTDAFRERVRAALARAGATDLADLHARLEIDRRERLAQLDEDYIRLRRRTLGTMIGGAFAAGAAAAIALPWMTRVLGPDAPLALAAVGAAVGIGIGVSFWLTSQDESGSRAA
jgi:hypothetical protein